MNERAPPENSVSIDLMARELLGFDTERAEELAMALAGDAVIRGDSGRAVMWLDVVECIITLKQKSCDKPQHQGRDIN